MTREVGTLGRWSAKVDVATASKYACDKRLVRELSTYTYSRDESLPIHPLESSYGKIDTLHGTYIKHNR